MKAAILIPVLTSHDAVGADALAMAAILDSLGIETRLFCGSASKVERQVWPAEDLPAFAGGEHDLVIYHFSTGWPAALAILARCRGRRVVKYHNITPAAFFRDYSADYEQACAAGRAELKALVELGCEHYIGDSAYNLDELIEMGLPPARGEVLAPFHRIDEIVAAEPDMELLNALGDGARNFLMVGRVAPNKGHVELVDAFAAFVHGWDAPARLIIVGKQDLRLQGYAEAIRARIRAEAIDAHVMWIETASERQLKAAYLRSHVLMMLSRHEGFCVPLIEAMALSVPIVAHASSAIPETLGPAGLAWSEDDPWLYAATAARVFADEAWRGELIEAGQRRYRECFSIEVLRQRFIELLGLGR